jgi:hypothetical protein
MGELDINNSESLNSNESPEEEKELSFSDKIVGVFTEPGVTYEKISKFPLKVTDWLVPYLILFLIAAVCNLFVMRNPEIKYQAKQKQMEMYTKKLDEQVQEKKITPEQADAQKSQMEKQMGNMDSPLFMVFGLIGGVVGGFIVVLIMAGYFYLFSKFIFKDECTFTGVLVANGMTSYITIINAILAAILSLFFGRLLTDVSAASILNIEKGTILSYLLNKVDIFMIWAYLVFAIGLVKINKANSSVKYYAMVFGSWVGWSLVFFFLTKNVPFLKGMGM